MLVANVRNVREFIVNAEQLAKSGKILFVCRLIKRDNIQ